MKEEYKVRPYMDNIYEVFKKRIIEENTYWSEFNKKIEEKGIFYGSLADCEAYIRLNEKGFFDY